MAKALNVSLAVTADTGQAKQQLQQLQQNLQQLATSSANLRIGISAGEIQKASQAALELSAHLKTATNVNTGTIDFTKLNSSIRSSGQSLEQYGQQLLKLGPQGRQAFTQLAQSVAKSEIPIKRLSSLLGNMGTVLANTIRWQLSSSVVHGFMGSIQTAYRYAQDLNKSLNNIQIVTQMSDTQMGKFAVTANKAAKALSTTTTSYTDAALIYYQQGIRDEKEITQRTNATIKMANVTGQSAQTVSDQMTAIWNNFADGSTNLEYYADVITALGAATASSSAEISRGLEKFAAIADTVGLSYENATAALATITATTRQSADTVGTGLRTLFSRLQSLSLGETLEDGVNLTKYSKALQTVGVEALDAQGNLRQMDDILADLGEKWQNLTDAQKTALAQTVGGVRQYTTLMALMDNFDFFKENQEVAKNAEGTLERQQQIYEKSWAAAAKRVRASAESIYSNLIDDSFFTKLTDNFAKFLDIVNNVITGLGGMKGILSSLGGALTSTFSDQAAAKLYKFGVSIRDMFTSPKVLAGRRDAFIANAAGIYAGLPIDPNTGYVEGAIFNKKTGEFDISGVRMSNYQRQMYDTMASQLANQQAYSKNAKFMTVEQQLAAQMALDQQTRTADDFLQAQEKNKQSKREVGKKIGDLYGEIMSSNKKGSLGRSISKKKLNNDTAASLLDRARTDFETKDKEYATALNLLEKIDRKELSSTALTDKERDILKLKPGDSLDLAAKQKEFEEARSKNRSEAQQKFTQFGGSNSAFSAYATAYQESLRAGMTEEEAKKAADQAYKNAQDSVNKTSRAVKMTQGAVNFGGGLMSATAAQAGLDSLINTVQQANAGLLSTKEAATQGLSAVASLAMNGTRAFSQFSAVLGPVGGIIATIATMALPYLIDMFDNMYETDAEKMERLNNQLEMAQDDLIQARQEYKDIFSDFDSHSKAIAGLKKMTAGTREFKDAIREANTQAEQLIDKYGLVENQDYYTDRNGAIRFRSGLEDELAQQKDQEIAQKEQGLELAEFNRDLNQLRQDKDAIKKAKNIALNEYSSEHGGKTMSELSDKEKEELKGYVKERAKDYVDEDFAKKYGYDSVEAMMNAYLENEAGLNDQMSAKSGIAEQYADVLEAQAKADDGVISDLEELSNQYLQNQLDVLGSDQIKLPRDIGTNKDYVEYKTSEGTTERVYLSDANDRQGNTERRERVYKAQLEELYGEAEADRMYNELIESQTYQGLTEKQKQQKLNGLLEQQELQKIIRDIAGENQELLKQIDTSKYEGYKSKSQDELAKVTPEGLDKAYKDKGKWYYENGEEITGKDLAEANMIDAISQQWGDAAANLHQALLEQTNLGITSEDIKVMSEDFSIDQLNTLSTYANMFGQMFGADTAGYIFAELTDEMKSGGSDLLDALDSIDWSDSNIDNLFSLQTAIDNLGDNQQELKQQLRNTADLIYDSIGGSAGLLEELYGSEGFADTLENLKETFEETGEISAESILSASKECKQLSKFLDITGVNAKGLADVLESIEIGDIGIEQVTDGLLQAVSAAGALEANLASVYQHIDNFKLDRSISDIGKFYKDLADQVESSQGAGMLYDRPLLQSWGELFGKNSLQAYKDWAQLATDEKNQTPQQISNDFNEQFAAEIAAMQSIQKRGNLSGMFEYFFNKNFDGGQVVAEIDGLSTALMHFDETTGQVVTDTDDAFQTMFAHQSDFIDYLSNNLDVPRDMAEAMAAEFAATDAWAHNTWGINAAQDGFDKLVQSIKDGNDLTIDALEVFYNQYEEFLGDKDFNAFTERFKKAIDVEGVKGSLIDLGDNFDYASGKYEDLVNAMGKEELTSYLDKNAKARSWFDDVNRNGQKDSGDKDLGMARDVNQLIKAYEKLGYTSAQANAVIANSGQVLSATYNTANNGLQTFVSTQQKYLDWVAEQYGLSADQAKSSVEAVLAYQEKLNHQAQTEVDASIYAEAFAKQLTDKKFNLNFDASNLKTVVEEAKKQVGEVTLHVGWEYDEIQVPDGTGDGQQTSGHGRASGYNNAKGFAGGKHSNGQYEGIADLGELGPELFIHDGQPYLAGVHGRTRAYIHKDDSVYTAAETRRILEENPSLQDIPGFSVGYNKVTWNKAGANVNNAKTSKYDPERSHLMIRQLKDLQREYDRLDKIKEKCYGTNKLEAIQREVDITNELIKGQKELIKETEDYLAIDASRLRDLLEPGEFQIDENGNLLNFEELQEKYRKKAEEDKDEQAQNIWKALQQYEETLDKLQEANVEMRDLLYQEIELRLEKITTKVDMRIDFDDREIKLLDHYIKRIDDNIYHTAEVLALTEEKLGNINQKIEDTKEGIHDLFTEMSDSKGNLITKADGTAYTLDDWLALTNEERDLLDINEQFGEQLEEYMDNLLGYIEELEDFKTKGVEEFSDAFDELNDNVRSSIDLFDHYNQLLSSLKNITDLQGIKLTAELKAARKEIDQIMFQNTQNNIQAENENYKHLVSEVEDLRIKIANTQDETLKKAWEEQLKTAEEQLRTSEQNMLSLWETGLDQAKNMFEQALQDAVDVYESAIAGMYGTVDELEKAWDQQKKNDDFYVKDFEKYYQIQKLQRSITKDLDAAARAGNKQNQGLKKLYNDLNAAREDGVELSSYDLDIYAKRYEYEKALMELEDARNNKNEVRLQRDANGNWGYIYTSTADEDDLIAKQQAVDNKFYELQKATQERVASLSDDLMSEITSVGQRLQELRSSGASQDTIDKYLEQEKLYLENYEKGLAKALEDAGMTEEEARSRYGDAGFDILNDFQETLFSAITGGEEGLDEFFNRVSETIKNTDSEMAQAGSEYQKQVSAIDKWFNESGEDLAKVLQGFAALVGEESSGTLLDSKEQIDNAKQTFADILQVARDFEKEFMTIYQPIIDANEQLVADLLEALHALNREEYEGPEGSNNSDASIRDIISDTGSSDNSSSNNSENSTNKGKSIIGYTGWQFNKVGHWRYAKYSDGSTGTTKYQEGPHVWNRNADGTQVCSICGYYKNQKNGQHITIERMATGGYTGSWGSEGRMAILDEKELVLNKDDTKNFLNATAILRTIDLQTGLFSKGLGNIITPFIADMQQGVLDQNVHIDATFPNVTDHNEIEAAFDNLINKASQYANRKNMSSMTFNDMYISRF